jgi:hypothetical protein
VGQVEESVQSLRIWTHHKLFHGCCLLLFGLLFCYTWVLGHFACCCTLYSFAILGCSAILSTWYLNESKWTVSELTLSEPDLYIFRPIWVLLLSLVEAFFVTLLWTPCGIWTIPHYGLWADACFGWSSKFLLNIESTPIQLVAWNNPFKLYMTKPWAGKLDKTKHPAKGQRKNKGKGCTPSQKCKNPNWVILHTSLMFCNFASD